MWAKIVFGTSKEYAYSLEDPMRRIKEGDSFSLFTGFYHGKPCHKTLTFKKIISNRTPKVAIKQILVDTNGNIFIANYYKKIGEPDLPKRKERYYE